MSDIQPYAPSMGNLSRPQRQVIRTVSRIRSQAIVRAVAADAATDIAMAKIENQTMATNSAMQAVVRVAKVQRELEQQAPEVSGRLALLADDHVLACVENLGRIRREMR